MQDFELDSYLKKLSVRRQLQEISVCSHMILAYLNGCFANRRVCGVVPFHALACLTLALQKINFARHDSESFHFAVYLVLLFRNIKGWNENPKKITMYWKRRVSFIYLCM